MGIISTIVMGAIAGYIAGLFVHSDKDGCIWNIIIGIVGGFVGGNVLSWLNISWGSGLWAQLATAVVGACILLWVWNLIRGK